MSLVCVRAEPEHAAAMAQFYRATWDPHASTEAVRASRQRAAVRNLAEPGVEPPVFLALHDGNPVGYVGTIPVQLWDGEEERPAYWIKGLTVLPTHRNGPIGFLLLREATRDLGCTAALVVAPEARRLFTALGYADVGVLTDYLRPLCMESVLRRLDPEALGWSRSGRWTAPVLRVGRTWIGEAIGRCLNVALRSQAVLVRLRRRLAWRVDEEPPAQVELDELWRRMQHQLQAAPVRDGRYIRNRYQSRRGLAQTVGRYLFVSVYRGAGLVGFGVVRRPSKGGDERLRGINVATLSDLVYAPEELAVGVAVLGAAERAALDIGADVLLCGTTAPRLARALRRHGYFRIGGRVHFLLRDVIKPGKVWPANAQSWWLTRGDSEADTPF